MRRFTGIWLILIACAALFGQYEKNNAEDIGLYGMTTPQQADDMEIGVTYILSDADIDSFFPKTNLQEELQAMYFSSEYAMIVEAEGCFDLYHRSMNQYADVIRIIRLKNMKDVTGTEGQPAQGAQVMLHVDGGFDFGYEEELDEYGNIFIDQSKIYYFELSALPMKKGNRYLIFANESRLNEYRQVPLYYSGSGIVEYFNLDDNSLSYCDFVVIITKGELLLPFLYLQGILFISHAPAYKLTTEDTDSKWDLPDGWYPVPLTL